jgi:protein-S-isoprenylcysteine O-methyltransferase Ste14
MTGTQVFWLIVGLSWTVSELLMALSTRKRQALEAQVELRSEKFIWLVICFSLLFALTIKNFHWFTIDVSATARLNIGCALLIFGLMLRIYSVYCLGAFFTTQVSIQSSHRLINNGPYRYIRHPSYTGLILGFSGAGIAMGDFLSLFILIIPLIYILIKRINIEEPLLHKHFGKDYAQYCQQTTKLFPGLY